MPVSRGSMIRAAAYLTTSLLSVRIVAGILMKSKGCSRDTGGLLICKPAGLSDLAVADYFIIAIVAAIITGAVWLVIGKR